MNTTIDTTDIKSEDGLKAAIAKTFPNASRITLTLIGGGKYRYNVYEIVDKDAFVPQSRIAHSDIIRVQAPKEGDSAHSSV